ncbi:MAG TPA: exonuclease SbcCD subunit D [Mobilitalea sp.]|nr:exonuclease SbcCD subunit D [Mobilitalea sp.]
MEGWRISIKLLHTADLHIGKRVSEFLMIEDQEYILKQILSIVDEQSPEGVLLAGDIYDKNIPLVEGVALFDWFLTELNKRNVAVFIVSGNHDSSERLNFGGRIMEKNRIYIAGTFQGKLEKITLSDENGNVNIYMLPFVKPANVNRYFPGVETYQEAVEVVLEDTRIDSTERNILVAHQFITSGDKEPERCDSEAISVGGLDNIDASALEVFDYVALGHIHGAQSIGRDNIRYAGSPLKYSFSEAKQVKSVTLIELGSKGEINLSKIPLNPLRDMREIKGPIDALTDSKIYSQYNTLDYIHATLTDEDEIYDAIGRLRSVYPNIMRLDFENSRSVWNADLKTAAEEVELKRPMELFEDFYKNQNNIPVNEQQKAIMDKLFEEMEVGKN